MEKLFYGPACHPITLTDLQTEVGLGWADLLTHLVTDLFALGWNGVVLQIKEKFGGLRFYTGETTDEMEKIIYAAEMQSYKICETCGAPGLPRVGRWVKTLCDEHSEGREPHSDLP